MYNKIGCRCRNTSNECTLFCQKAQKEHNVSIIADGGINKSGDIVKALTLSNAVICGGLLAGCKESPGRIVEIEGNITNNIGEWAVWRQ